MYASTNEDDYTLYVMTVLTIHVSTLIFQSKSHYSSIIRSTCRLATIVTDITSKQVLLSMHIVISLNRHFH